MAGFDVDAALRWARLARRRAVSRRPDHQLPFVREDWIGGQAVLLDTCVYIDQMQGRSPEILDALIGARQANHSTVAIQVRDFDCLLQLAPAGRVLFYRRKQGGE